MVGYRRLGNMEQNFGNATSTASIHKLWDLWNNPRRAVLLIQALAVVAIIFSFFLAAFGSCRRWSNRWMVQKGFFAAHVLSLSLGTYSIGLMQSSSVKSEMYPIWTVSLFTLFGCIDPVTAYQGLDYKGPLSKIVFQICLSFGYVLLMCISTMSSDFVNAAIYMLSAITFIKGFHRSFALMQQSRMRDMVQFLPNNDHGETCILRNDSTSTNVARGDMKVDFCSDLRKVKPDVRIADIDKVLTVIKEQSCYDVCIAFSLSHKLHQHFLGLGYRMPCPESLKGVDYKWALKVIEIELAFLYEVFFTGNAFFHYYQAKAASLWALASLVGICFVGIAVAIPGTFTSHHDTPDFVDTITTDLVITFVILVSLSLLQLMHLIRCWTSNWARVAVACAYARNNCTTSSWMRFKAFVATSTNWFDKNLWQDQIGQYSMLPEGKLTRRKVKWLHVRTSSLHINYYRFKKYWIPRFIQMCYRLVKMLGLDYIWEVIWDLLGSDIGKRAVVKLDDKVKESIIDFLGQIETDRLDENWLSFSKDKGSIERYLPYFHDPHGKSESHGYRYTMCVMIWHTATWLCERKEQRQKQDALSKAEDRLGIWETVSASATYYLKKGPAGCFKSNATGERLENRNRLVANALSKYCAYLVVSAPELIPGPTLETKRANNDYGMSAWMHLHKYRNIFRKKIGMPEPDPRFGTIAVNRPDAKLEFEDPWDIGRRLANQLFGDNPTGRSQVWDTLALVWVRLLVYAAPYGNAEAHMQRLRQGGEFITHIWALLYHLDIREWKLPQALQNITTMEEAEGILTEDDQSAVAFLDSLSGSNYDELVIASKTETGVRFYHTLSYRIAKRFHTELGARSPGLVVLNKKLKRFTLYDGEFRADDIVSFVSANKLPLDKKSQAQETAPSTFDNPMEMQSLEDGGQRENGIEEEITPTS